MSSDSVSNTKGVFSMSQSVWLFSDSHFFFLAQQTFPSVSSVSFSSQSLTVCFSAFFPVTSETNNCQLKCNHSISRVAFCAVVKDWALWKVSEKGEDSLFEASPWQCFFFPRDHTTLTFVQLSELFHFRLRGRRFFLCVVRTNFPETNLMSIKFANRTRKNWTFSLFWGSFLEDSAFWTPNSVAGQKFGNGS